jgi:2-polyprenyl-6-methoxyphenol hydroxylase-like FAD-dependent oxidoreductase
MRIGIAGAGMGGLAIAAMLARDGHHVVVHDRMERPAPVGSGFVLQPTGLAVLDLLGLRPTVEERGSRIDRMLGLACPSQRTVLDVGYPRGTYGMAVQRSALFDLLLTNALEDGVVFETSRSVINVDEGPRRRLLMEDGRSSPPFDLVVDAMGSGSPLRPDRSRTLPYGALWATVPWTSGTGFDANTLEQRYFRASRMAGILPVGTAHEGAPRMATLFWSVRRDEDPRRDMDAWRSSVHDMWPEASCFASAAEPVMARYRHHTHGRPVGLGLARIGDSWHATSPQLGQGANMALIDALALSTAIRCSNDVPRALTAYAGSRRAHVGFYQALSTILTPFYQSDSRVLPLMRDHLIAPLLRRRGIVHAMIAAMVTGGVLDPVGRATRIERVRQRAAPLPA